MMRDFLCLYLCEMKLSHQVLEHHLDAAFTQQAGFDPREYITVEGYWNLSIILYDFKSCISGQNVQRLDSQYLRTVNLLSRSSDVCPSRIICTAILGIY